MAASIGWGDWIRSFVNPQEIATYAKWRSMEYAARKIVIEPTFRAARRGLDYLETDDPETPEERAAFDRAERLHRLQAQALSDARAQRMNRRQFVENSLSLRSDSDLSFKVRGVLKEAELKVRRYG